MSWFNFKSKKENTAEIFDASPEVKEKKLSKIEKGSKGTIDEASSFGIGYGENYVDRIFQLNGLTISEMWRCYTENPWVRACVDKIVKEVVKYKIKIRPKDQSDTSEETQKQIEAVQNLLDNPNDRIESFDNLRRKYLKDILIYDAGALEIVNGTTETKKQLYSKLNSCYKELQRIILNKKSEDNVNKEQQLNDLENNLKEEIKIIKAKIKEVDNKASSTPQELYDICGPDIKVNVDKHGNFTDESSAYYLVDNMGKPSAEFSINELIYFSANPTAGSVYGISPLETLYNIVQADNQAAKLNRRRLDSDGIISGVLSFPGMSANKLKANQTFWKMQAKQKGATLVVTSSKDVNFVRVSESHQEMQFMEYQKWTLTQIMAVYGMQPIVLGVIDNTTGKLNSKEQRSQFKSDAILPLLSLEVHHLNDVLIRQAFGYKNIELYHEEPEQEFTKIENSEIAERMGKLGVITINEAREMIGLEQIDEGDILVMVSTLKDIHNDITKGQRKDSLEEIRRRIADLLEEPKPKVDFEDAESEL
jgi:HK97 family phage portal protein